MLASSSESAALTGRQSASRNGGVGGKQQNAPPAQSLIQNQGVGVQLASSRVGRSQTALQPHFSGINHCSGARDTDRIARA